MALIRYIGIEGLERSPAVEAADILRDGGKAILPTETLYGLSGDAACDKCLRGINILKGRKPDEPQIVLLRYEWIQKYIENWEDYMPLIDAFAPGPLTFIAPAAKNARLSKVVIEKGKIAFRVSGSWFADLVLDILKKPITSTSVNLAGDDPLFNPMDIIASFDDRVDGIFLFQDENLSGPPSTIVDISNFPELEIIREGAISSKAIMTAMTQVC